MTNIEQSKNKLREFKISGSNLCWERKFLKNSSQVYEGLQKKGSGVDKELVDSGALHY